VVRKTPKASAGASATHSIGKPSMCGNTPNVRIMPTNEASSVPMAIWLDMRVGCGEDEASAQVAAAVSTRVLPLGHAVASQNAPSSAMTIAARRPATPAAIQLVFGT
jgi:hypothetical protein